MAVSNPPKPKLQALVSDLKLCKQLGAGGNAVVYEAKSKDQRLAIKFLINADPKRFERFRDEVLVVTNTLQGSRYVIPILEHHFPAASNGEFPWYTMPVATPLRKHLEGATKAAVLGALIELADGLAELHAMDVAHRDIKPENLFFYENAFRYGDFGIAKFPESSNLTTETEPVGPVGYIADEMIRHTATADPYKADVFSFAKTVWAILTNEKYPFLGQYSSNGRYALDKFLKEEEIVHEPLDTLLKASTQNTPEKRPTASDFAAALREARDALNDFSIKNVLQWDGAETSALSIPCARAEWTNSAEIVSVLKILSRRSGLNHCFLPGGGGWHVTGAESTEGGNATLLWHDEKLATVLKPTRLTLERLE
jgi:serine/threonine protein kinase